jgi:photosystem II stability/assembly factor-like uncharacterized protein
MKTTLLVGTKKGAYFFKGKGKKFIQTAEHFGGYPVHHLAYDGRNTPTIYAAWNAEWFGSTIQILRRKGKTWGEWEKAKVAPGFSKGSGLKLKKIWIIRPGLQSEKHVVYAGVEPAALFRSENGGETWEPVTGLNEHPHAKSWQPGSGLCLHTIVRVDADTTYVAISTGGVCRSKDGMKSWAPVNKGVSADFMPEKNPEYGHCVHKIERAPDGTFYMQNHGGVLHSKTGDDWKQIDAKLPSNFGFALGVHPNDPNRAWVIPVAPETRTPIKGAFAVYRTGNCGKTWDRLSRGLPQKNAYLNVLRDGMAVDAAGNVYIGTNTGQLFASFNGGDSWTTLADYLPPIYSVTAADIE